MSDVGILISQYLANVDVDDGTAGAVARQLASEIESKKLKFLDLVKALGDYLTAEDDLLRPKAMNCLSATLEKLAKDALAPNDLAVLSSFYNSKLDDAVSMKETLFGTLSLIQMDNYAPGNLKALLQALQRSYVSTKYLAPTRHNGLQIMEAIFTIHNKYIQRFISDLYIKTFVHVATGEKDPRNLLISFSLNHRISSTLDITEDQDDLFDILFCYFPISFKPPKDDPYKITSDMLKQTLREGIASSPLFAKDAYPNLLEKLTSTSPTVKRDTIETITRCIKNYGFQSLLENWVQLWDALKFEILHGDETDDENGIFPLVLNVFKTIAMVLSEDEEQLSKFFKTVHDELKPNLLSKTVKQACAIFGAIASAGVVPFNAVVKPVLGHLLKDTQNLNVAKERTLIANIGIFTKAYIEVFGTFDTPKVAVVDDTNALKSYKDEILIVLGKALMGSSKVEVSLRTLAVAELTKITTLCHFLAGSELSLIVQYLTETVLFDDTEYVYNSCIGGLVQIAKIDTGVLLEVTFPTLLSLLPDADDGKVLINDEAKPKEKIFEILGATCTNSAIVNFMFIRLINKLEAVSSKPENLKYSFLIVSTLQDMIVSSQRSQQFSTDSHLSNSFKTLTSMLLNSTGSLQDDNIMESASEIIKLIVVYSTKTYHQQLLDETKSLFTGGDMSQSTYFKDMTCSNILDSPSKFVNVMVKIIAGVDKSVKFDDVEEFIGKLIKIVETSEFVDTYTKIGYLRLISLLVNKWGKDSAKYETMTLDSSLKIEVFTWIAKGVILKIDPTSVEFVNKLVTLLADPEFGSIAPKSFEVIVVDINIFDKFKKIMNNNVRLLYKQKFFEIVTPLIVEKFTDANDMSIKSNYLTALSLILKHTKKEIIAPHLSSFFPLLLQSLSLPNSEVRLASLQTMLSSMDEISELLGQHLQTIIPSLLELSVVDSQRLNTADVRLVAINCLHGLSMIIPLEKLVGYQKSIIKVLTEVLDDKKRKVRKSAVDARQAYFELGISPAD